MYKALLPLLVLSFSSGCVVETTAADDDDGQSSAAPASSGSGGAAETSSGSAGAGGSGGGATGGSGSGGDPAFGGSSNGIGGPAPATGQQMQAGSVSYHLIAPSSPATPVPLLVVFSGTEGDALMTQNLLQVAEYTNSDGYIRAILDGVSYNGQGSAGATVIDALRGLYDIDNDRMYLMGESAGTSAALELGFELRQSYFAAFWANDINAGGSPEAMADALGFQPWGQVGPGGQQGLASQIVSSMQAAGYRTDSTSPYAGAGAGQHGSTEQFLAAVSWFSGKTRR